MIDPSFDMVEVTPEADSLLKVMDLERKIIELECNVASMTQNWEVAKERIKKYVRQIDQFEQWLKNQVIHNDLDKNDALEAAEIFGITLERDYDITVTVTFSGSVKVPFDFDMEGDLEDALTARLEASYYGAILEYDLMEDSMEIDYQESY